MKLLNSQGRKFITAGSHAVYADVDFALPVIDIHQQSKKSGAILADSGGRMRFNLDGIGGLSGIETYDPRPGGANLFLPPSVLDKQLDTQTAPMDSNQKTDGGGIATSIPLDFHSWLPFAAPKYKISADPKDYLIVPVIAVPSDLPNRNRIAFPLKQLLAFNPELGQQAYRTWVGKPTYTEHKNDVIEEAYGVIIDSSLVKLHGWAGGKVWKLLMLAAFDRSKYVEYVARIASGDVNSYSMGAWVEEYECSVCGAEVGQCSHVALKDNRATLTEANGRLAFKNCKGIVGFELSSVGNPAWIPAISDHLMSLS